MKTRKYTSAPLSAESLNKFIEHERRIAEGVAECRRLRSQIQRIGYGHIYVIEFASDVIKVGRSFSPEARLAQHAEMAKILGTGLTRSWVSEKHISCNDTERALIQFGHHHGEAVRPSGRGEYFKGLDFGYAQEYAERLVLDAQRRAYLDRLTEAAGNDLSMTWEEAHNRLVEIDAIDTEITTPLP